MSSRILVAYSSLGELEYRSSTVKISSTAGSMPNTLPAAALPPTTTALKSPRPTAPQMLGKNEKVKIGKNRTKSVGVMENVTIDLN
ncbi:hypothetical protein HNP33_001147 [Comamonas odontotermitis]|uniref:Uncharacterized protein n=1 Tax=Comamonas odontotermitis TaxID=379895 RepID=A0ABR6RD77_9BURK|nr:hypothetical protein [Comamonas odontotermitis]MBB6577096.1 hypothetical protein [Comamonas odontotermitis]